MKTIIKGALALVLLASTAQAALAQDGEYNPAMRASTRNVPPALQDPQAQPQAQPQGPSQHQQDNRHGGAGSQSRHHGHQPWQNDHRWNNGGDRGWNNQHGGGDRHWRHDRQQRPRFDHRHYGQTYRSHQRYRGYAYRPPSGFYIRSWSYGDQLPRSWWSSQYRLNDWWSYNLPIPPIGYDYVRVGDNVLLVDMFSGRVVQVVRNVFW